MVKAQCQVNVDGGESYLCVFSHSCEYFKPRYTWGLDLFLTAVKSSVAPSQYYLVWHKEREKTSMNFNGPFLGVRELLLYLKFRAKDYLSIHCI